MQAFYVDVKGRIDRLWRNPEECAIVPQVTLVLGETEAIAAERAEFLQSLVDPG